MVGGDAGRGRTGAGPANFGATVEASTPWLQLVLYVALRQGPPCLVMAAGQRLWRLPPPLLGAFPPSPPRCSGAFRPRCRVGPFPETTHSPPPAPSAALTAGARVPAGATHVLLWPWSPAAVRAEAVPTLLPADFLLPQLNEALTRTALLLHPLQLPDGVRRSHINAPHIPLLLGEPDATVKGFAFGIANPKAKQ